MISGCVRIPNGTGLIIFPFQAFLESNELSFDETVNKAIQIDYEPTDVFLFIFIASSPPSAIPNYELIYVQNGFIPENNKLRAPNLGDYVRISLISFRSSM